MAKWRFGEGVETGYPVIRVISAELGLLPRPFILQYGVSVVCPVKKEEAQNVSFRICTISITSHKKM